MSTQHLIGRYEVKEEIASGGMGTIYKAWDPHLQRAVALKCIKADLATNKVVRERFLREARSMAQVKHDNIATIHDVVPNQDTPFMVMEYYTGGNLSHKLRQLQPGSGLPLPRAVAIVHQIAMALACAHDRGVIHRDIKPGNVLFDSDDKVKLTDFGIAAARKDDVSVTQDPSLTRIGQVLGTTLYMAPEQSLGEPSDQRTDLYSLGLMFYEMVTGSHPRRGLKDHQIQYMLDKEERAVPLSFDLSIPSDVQTIINGLVRYRHVDRTKDSHHLIRQLESLSFGPRPIPSTAQNVGDADDKTRYELPTRQDLSTPSREKQVQWPEPKPEPKPTAGSWTTRVALVGGIAVLLAVGGYFIVKSTSVETGPGPVTGTNQGHTASNGGAPPPGGTTGDTRLIKQRLSDFKEALVQRDLKTLDMISVMTESRREWVKTLFQEYKAIEASLGEIVTTSNEVSTILRIEKLYSLTGDPVVPDSGSRLKNITLTISREDESWGKIHW